MKKIIFPVFVLFFVLIQSASAFREQKPFSLELEYFAPLNIYDKEAILLQDLGLTGTAETVSGLGLRFTYLYPVSNNIEVGGSLGYIMGPKTEFVGSGFWLGDNYEREVSFIRLLGELKTEIPIGDDWSINPSLSAGIAFGKVEYSDIFTVDDESWSGFAWEISVPFIYKDYIFALKYAGFPTYEDGGVEVLKWNTFGLSAGYRFNIGSGGGSSSGRYYDDDEYRPNQHQAKRDFEEEEEYEPESYAGYVEQAENFLSQGSYMKAAGKYTGALRFLESDDPRRIYILERQGTTLGKQEKFNEGIKFYMTAIKVGKKLNVVNRDVVNAYLGLSYCQVKIGNIPWAIINYKSARKLTKSQSLKLKIDQALERLAMIAIE